MMKQNTRRRQQTERTWAEIFCLGCCAWLQLTWRRVVLRKWLNVADDDSDYSADTESDSNSEQETYDWSRKLLFQNQKQHRVQLDDATGAILRLRRRKSETLRAQYIKTKEIKICAATWNVGGKFPTDDLDLDCWIDVDDPADIYVIGLQEMIPLDAGNVLGAEDDRPVPKWENIIRETLNQIPKVTKFKSFSEPSSPLRYRPSDGASNVEDNVVLESDSDSEEEIHPLGISNCLATEDSRESMEASTTQFTENTVGTLSGTDLERNNSIKPTRITKYRMRSNVALIKALDLDFPVNRKRRHQYVRIVSKQMVGIFVTIWARRKLRRHIKNLNVCTVGVGLMGYLGNKVFSCC